MKIEVSKKIFITLFKMNGWYEHYGWLGLEALYSHLMQTAPDCDLDLLEIRNEWERYENAVSACHNFGAKTIVSEEKAIEYLQKKMKHVIRYDLGVLVCLGEVGVGTIKAKPIKAKHNDPGYHEANESLTYPENYDSCDFK